MTTIYDRETYWSEVASRMAARKTGREVAGDADAYYMYKKRKMAQRFLNVLPVDGRVVMELGCGPGGNLEWLLAHRKPEHLIGVDISSEMLRLARERLGARVTLHKTDGNSIPIADGSVDVAYSVTVLQHNTTTAQVEALVLELARITRGPIILMEDTGPLYRGDSWVVRPVDQYDLAMRAAGYRLSSTEYLGLRVSRGGYSRIVRRLGPIPEGAHPSPVRRAIIAAWIAVAAPLDCLVADSADLTKMVFERA
jgi:SAM-dependent methyltransferase